jgi:3-methyladenine DNA glycosylase Tag
MLIKLNIGLRKRNDMGCQSAQFDNYFQLTTIQDFGNLHDVIENILFYAMDKCPDTIEVMNFYRRLSPEKITDKFLLEELSWITYAGGFRYDVIRKYWPKITEAFFDFDVSRVALLYEDLDAQAKVICEKSGFRNIAKAKWCIFNAQRIIQLDYELSEIGGLKGYFLQIAGMDIRQIVENKPIFLNDLKFKGIGKTTIFHLLKNMGIDIFKPDIHVCRMLQKLGLISKTSSILDICEAMHSLASSYDIKVSELDTLLFVYGKTTSDNVPFSGRKF